MAKERLIYIDIGDKSKKDVEELINKIKAKIESDGYNTPDFSLPGNIDAKFIPVIDGEVVAEIKENEIHINNPEKFLEDK